MLHLIVVVFKQQDCSIYITSVVINITTIMDSFIPQFTTLDHTGPQSPVAMMSHDWSEVAILSHAQPRGDP